MTTDYRMRCLFAVLLAGLVAAPSFAAPPPVEAFGQRPALIDVDLNPSGTRLTWIENDGKESRIVIYDLATQKDLRKLTVPAETKLHAVYWANDETILINQSVTRSQGSLAPDTTEWQRWSAVDAAGGDDRILLMTGGDRGWVTGATLIRRRTAKPGKVFMSTLDFSAANYRTETGTRLAGGKKDSGWISSLYEVDLATGEGRVVESGTPFTDDWLVDETVSQVVRSEWIPTRLEYEIRAKVGRNWKTLYRAERCGRMSLVAITPDKSAVIAQGQLCDQERIKLWAFPFDGSPPKLVLEDAALDVEGIRLDPLDQKLLSATLSGSGNPRWLDASAERRFNGLQRTFAADHLSIVGRSSDYKRVVVLAENATHPPIYYLVDYNAKTADIINEKYPKLNGVKLGTVEEFRYEARDKYALMAFLTLPADSPRSKLPLVVLPHGGPEAHDDHGFDWLAQFFASRGYAVLQPQFRGSSGYGRAHADAGRRQWGLRMQDDVTDGVLAVMEKGIADPNRICIVGWSYGGYAALAGAAFTPELYRCAASIAGVSDLPVMLRHTARDLGKESNSFAYWRDHIGPANDPQVIAKSPARSATTIRAPLLLLHGTDDTIVPIAQSQIMARALDAARKQYALVELPGDDHNLYTSAMRVRMLTELERFLAPHLGVLPPAQASN